MLCQTVAYQKVTSTFFSTKYQYTEKMTPITGREEEICIYCFGFLKMSATRGIPACLQSEGMQSLEKLAYTM